MMCSGGELLSAEAIFEKASELDELRKQLLTGLRYILNEAKRFISGPRKTVDQKVLDNMQRKNIPAGIDFSAVCKYVIATMEGIEDNSNCNILDKERVMLIKTSLERREVLISFYGDSNVGKSTLLNGILKDRYLPSRQDAETGMSVYIYFRESFHPTSHLPLEGVLCEQNDPSTYIAKGAVEIKKSLKQLNSQRRLSVTCIPQEEFEVNTVQTPSEVYLYLNQQFGRTRSHNIKFIMLDNPGFGEYGSAQVQESVQKSRAISAAFIFVTTLDTYQTIISSRMLRELYTENKRIFKQNRLLIVITKLDLILQNKRDEDFYTEDEAIKRVRDFLCYKLNVASEDLPSNAVIAVSGEWAISTRGPRGDDYDKYIDMELGKLRDVESQAIKETPGKDISDRLEKRSNIAKLEHRLEEMAKNSLSLWRRKIADDLTALMDGLKKWISSKYQSIDQRVSEIQENTTKYGSIIMTAVSIYSEILSYYNERSRPRDDSVLWQLFKSAYVEDMQREGTKTTEDLLDGVKKSIEGFKHYCQQQIEKKTYTPEDFENDLVKKLTSEAKHIQQTLTSENSYTSLMKVYEEMCQQKYKNLIALSASLQQILQSDKSAATATSDMPSIRPKVMMELKKYTVKIPIGEFKIVEAFKNALKKIFGLKLPEKEFTVEVDYSTGAQPTPVPLREKTITVYKKWSPVHEKIINEVWTEAEEMITNFSSKKEELVLKKVYAELCKTLFSILKATDGENAELFNQLNSVLSENMKKLAELQENYQFWKMNVTEIDELRCCFMDYCSGNMLY